MEEPIPRDLALQQVAETSLSVVLAQGQHSMVPAKLYESVALGVPTLVITESDSASAAAATRVGAIQREPNDIEGIADVLRSASQGSAANEVSTFPFVHAEIAQVADRLLRKVIR